MKTRLVKRVTSESIEEFEDIWEGLGLHLQDQMEFVESNGGVLWWGVDTTSDITVMARFVGSQLELDLATFDLEKTYDETVAQRLDSEIKKNLERSKNGSQQS